MLVTVFNSYHMPQASQITTWETLFTERLFCVFKELVGSWSHVSLIIYHKTFAKKPKAVSSAIHWLTCFRVSSGLFLVPFWMLWMLVTVYKLCHVPHALQITTWGTIFTKRNISVFKEWVRSWSRAFLIAYHKTLTKKPFGGRSRKNDEKEKKKKTKQKLQARTKYLRKTLIFMWNSALRERFNFYFQEVFY